MANGASHGPRQTAQPNAMYRNMEGKIYQPLLDGLNQMGYENMTPVQQKVLTELPTFKSDCLVQAKTGTGKTIAFLLPLLHTLLTERSLPKGQVGILIISPTRELALQIAKECNQLTASLSQPLQCHTAFGGTSKDRYLKEFLNQNPSVLVATPGRLDDYLSDGYVAEKFRNIRAVVLDEADSMLDAGFLPSITKILRALPAKSTGWQGMCFSATMPEKIKSVLSNVLKPGYTHLSTVDPDEVPTIDQVIQYSVIVPRVSDTFTTLYALLEQERQQSPNDFKAIIFGSTANGVAFLHELFSSLYGARLKVYQLQSRLTQSQRTRTTEEFKQATSGLMFASDVIGRGMDFPNVGLVIQVGLPSSAEQYVHRVGRTARAGTSGRAVILLTDREKYFVTTNSYLPIQPYPLDIAQIAIQVTPAIDQALTAIDERTVGKAYQAFLGFNKTFMKQLRLDPVGLVALSNEVAAAMGAPELPMIDKRVVGKMGLKGTKGLNVGTIEPQAMGRNQKRKNDGSNTPTNARGKRLEDGMPRLGMDSGDARIGGPPARSNGSSSRGSGRGRGAGPGRKGGRTKQHQGPPDGFQV